MSGFATRAMNSMQPTSTRRSRPYSAKTSSPFCDTVEYTSPSTPNGASAITQRTTVDTASDTLANTSFTVPDAARSAMPSTTAHTRMPR